MSVIKKNKTKQTLAQRKQVWYHVCPNRGRGCYNTRLKEDGGCTIWYNEKEVRRDASHKPCSSVKPRRSKRLYSTSYPFTVKTSSSTLQLCPLLFNCTQLLSDIEEHLKCTITQCEPDIKIPVDEFDGKVTYGQRRALGGLLHNQFCYHFSFA